MALREDLEKQGAWLFKWRSYIPLIIIPLLAIALKDFGFIEQTFGDTIGDLWECFAVFIAFLGLLIRCMTAGYVPAGTSGRNTQTQVAETINTTGMYSITRNPLYLGNFVIMVGIAMFIQVWWLALMILVGFWLYYERIIFTEEEFLRNKFGRVFTDWAEKTPMVIPRFSSWQKPNIPFSFKTVLRREFTTYFAIVATCFFLELFDNVFIDKHFSMHSSWIIFFLVSLAIYLTFLILKKKTNILRVTGR